MTRVQILDETDCISHSTNTLGKGQTGFFSLGEATSLGEGKLCLKIDLVSYPARAEGLVNMIFINKMKIMDAQYYYIVASL